MKIASWNVNGIRSVAGKGFLDWFSDMNADIVCVQEIKAKPEQLADSLRNPHKYHAFWHPAEKPGYSGVAVFSKREPDQVTMGIGIPEFDREGRVLTLDYGKFVLINSYFPNSQREHQRLGYKLAFCDAVHQHLDSLVAQGKHVIICGDYNIAHNDIDLKNPKANLKNAGFLPQERAWMSRFLGNDYVDLFRHFEKGPGHYTWWSNRPTVRERNIGWRLDYFCSNNHILDQVKSCEHLSQVKGSDHCPVVMTLKP